jgi:hypothetical protein
MTEYSPVILRAPLVLYTAQEIGGFSVVRADTIKTPLLYVVYCKVRIFTVKRER